MTVKINAFWGVAVCSVVESYKHFGGTYYLHRQVDEWEAKESRTVMGPISFGKQKENWRPLGTVTGSNKSTGVSSLAWS
jgi:hypothetical protein